MTELGKPGRLRRQQERTGLDTGDLCLEAGLLVIFRNERPQLSGDSALLAKLSKENNAALGVLDDDPIGPPRIAHLHDLALQNGVVQLSAIDVEQIPDPTAMTPRRAGGLSRWSAPPLVPLCQL